MTTEPALTAGKAYIPVVSVITGNNGHYNLPAGDRRHVRIRAAPATPPGPLRAYAHRSAAAVCSTRILLCARPPNTTPTHRLTAQRQVLRARHGMAQAITPRRR